ncbi:MAG: OmpA family protein [Brachymonas sp.]|uniref:OmpA family protein n=1 Tax=unclassified Brachymonas TaxID=2621329 RepID=UPI0035B34B83
MNKTLATLTAGALATSLLAGCAADGNGGYTMTESGRATSIGAGLGALAGAVVGNAHSGSDTLRGAAIGAALGAAGGYLWSNHMQQQKAAMEQATAGTPVQVSQTADNRLKINVPADAGFATNSAVLNSNMRPILDRLAQTLNQNPVTYVSVIGHTDNTGTDAINNPLSLNRANAARDYLVAHGVAPSRITTTGMGSAQPVASNATAAGRAENRRVEIYVGEPAKR